ncbi:thiazole biosynthesis adenylyltransferase ThiF [Halobacillus naozhouensis]|uniref:Thiazole biosynthesis adenylyltransferase ThiF n=1 Tax=Halobacillus naozhouensis TaxID=554880 RepID=A0ABY8IY55_9BACI|nr:thiazole biosynthesis adenylyltransferase ThiF [Halobacillus naozhouensis]WFT75150.1 thiazole biosynthesis adenylyltransferase ThiF [Halobacillus naozhouensis]
MSADRYSRQKLFAPIGQAGQQLIREKHVVIIGAGALGASSAEQLVRAGIGHLTIVDRDYVEMSNLQRQQLYSEEDAELRTPKAIAAKGRLQQINSDVSITELIMDVQREELEELFQAADLVLDATDNFETRMMINDVSQLYHVPWIYGGCVGSYGLSYTIIPGQTPCLHCLLETVPLGGATCDTVGVISPAVHMVTAHQVTEALKIIVEDFDSLHKKLISFDLWNNQYTSIKMDNVKKAECPSCGEDASYPFLSPVNQTKTAVLCGRDTVQIRPAVKQDLNLESLRERLHEGDTSLNPFLLSYQTGEQQMVFFKDGRVLIHGTKDITEARRLYHKILG